MDIEHSKAKIFAKNDKNEKRYAKEIKDRDTQMKQKNTEQEIKRVLVMTNKKKNQQWRDEELRHRA